MTYAKMIVDADDCTVTDYAWSCIRSFLWECRDDDGPIPVVLDRDDEINAHREQLRLCEERLAEARAMTREQLLARCRQVIAENRKEHDTYVEQRQRENEKLEAMLGRVDAWQPPEELLELKIFMIRQIRTEFLVPGSFPDLTDDEAIEGYVDGLREDVGLARRALHGLVTGVERRNKLVGALHEALPMAADTIMHRVRR